MRDQPTHRNEDYKKGRIVKELRLVVISNCAKQCPHVLKRRTPGTGFAEDYLCSKTKATTGGTWADFRTIAGYVEWSSELPKDGEFPDWCPLFVAEPGMYDTPKEVTP